MILLRSRRTIWLGRYSSSIVPAAALILFLMTPSIADRTRSSSCTSGNIEVYDRDRCFVCDCLVSELVDALNELAEPDSSWVELNDSFFVSVVDVRALYADKLGNVLLDRCGAVYARHAFYRYNGFFSVHNLFYHKAIAGQRGKRHTMSNITVFE